jgi:hypothetical protein
VVGSWSRGCGLAEVMPTELRALCSTADPRRRRRSQRGGRWRRAGRHRRGQRGGRRCPARRHGCGLGSLARSGALRRRGRRGARGAPFFNRALLSRGRARRGPVLLDVEVDIRGLGLRKLRQGRRRRRGPSGGRLPGDLPILFDGVGLGTIGDRGFAHGSLGRQGHRLLLPRDPEGAALPEAGQRLDPTGRDHPSPVGANQHQAPRREAVEVRVHVVGRHGRPATTERVHDVHRRTGMTGRLVQGLEDVLESSSTG